MGDGLQKNHSDPKEGKTEKMHVAELYESIEFAFSCAPAVMGCEGHLRRCRHLFVRRPDFRSRFKGGEVNLRSPDPGVEGAKDRGAGDSPDLLPSGL